jgi:Fe-S-cluster-containing hydrogenase component 2
VIDLYYPLRSLREGTWFKLICGASFQYLPDVRNLTLAYALAGIDCVDVAADSAVIAATRDALRIAASLATTARAQGFPFRYLPWLMVSLNDGEDPHFRKAEFDSELCPESCPRPCEAICPAQAIVFEQPAFPSSPSDIPFSGVIDSRCYGCGRCVPICPIQQISTRASVLAPTAIAPLLRSGVDAVEIHTQVGRLKDFERLWQAIAPSIDHLKLVAISCPDGEELIDYLWALYDLISPLPCALIWQTDGRPMSGDIGDGATRAAVRLGQKVLASELPGYVQLAGGTNSHTVPKLQTLGLLKSGSKLGEPTLRQIAGVAYGSYARGLLSPVLHQLEQCNTSDSFASNQPLEAVPDLLWQAVALANNLVSPLKSMDSKQPAPPSFL